MLQTAVTRYQVTIMNNLLSITITVMMEITLCHPEIVKIVDLLIS